ncbi:MAG: hypothetical protein KF883_10755 [Thermomicrobiales bacterium]|nr:hypothetical protein [Thermomicrobiales bacterium]
MMVPPTSLIGREELIRDTVQSVAQARVTTLTGPGGVGKTRVALDAARRHLEMGAWRVVVIPLASVADSCQVAPVLAQWFGLADVDEASLPDRLSHAINGQETLVVLDNFEQVLPRAILLADIVAACPTIRFLVTSRVRLRISFEREMPVPPLSFDREKAGSDHCDVAPAVRLFVERASLDLNALDSGELLAIEQICHRADGLPLAIELAASKTRLLGLNELAQRMTTALPLLVDGPRDAPERLQTMHSAIRWSYDLLGPEEQHFFVNLSVFSGGFTIASAAGIAAQGLTTDVMTLLQSLLDHSLIVRMADSESPQRFTLLETLREFGREQLRCEGREDSVHDRHAQWFASLLETDANRDVHTSLWLATTDARDEGNLRTALSWMLSRGDKPAAARLALLLTPFWWRNGFFSSARENLNAILALPGSLPPELMSRLLGAASEFAMQQSDFKISAHLASEALEIAREMGDQVQMLRHLRRLCWATGVTDHAAAIPLVEETLELSRRLGDMEAIIQTIHLLQCMWVYAGDFEIAQELTTEAGTLVRAFGNETNRREHQHIQGSLRFFAGDFDASEPFILDALEWRRSTGSRVFEMHCLRDLGRIALERGDMRGAAERFSSALDLANLIGSRHGLSYCLVEAAAVSRDAETAAMLFGGAEAMRKSISLESMPIEVALQERVLRSCRDSLGPAQFEVMRSLGGTKPPSELVRLAQKALDTQLDAPRAPDHDLSPREREVLVLICQGKSDREIGEMLFISRRTAASHSGNILAKLGVHSRAEAAAWAVRNEVA